MIETKYNKSSLLKSISHFSVFEGVPIYDLGELVREGTILNYKKGQKIHREGEKSTEFLLILEGMVIFSKVSSTGREFVVDWGYAGWPLGWGQIIEGGCFTATSTALVDTSVISFSKEKFLVILSRNPIILKRISNQSVDLINKLFNNLIDVSTDTANNRLIRTLISLCKINGNTLNLTHQEIAQIAWTTIETTTRILSKLKKDKIVSIERGKIIINNPEKLSFIYHDDAMIETKYNKSSLLKSISHFSLFEGVPISDLGELVREGTILNYKKGQKIHREGEKSTEFPLVLEGMVIFSKASSTGREFVVDWRYAGGTGTLGWGQIIEGGCFTATCTALVDTSVISFSKEKFLVFLSRNPIVMERVSNLSVDLINTLFNNLVDVSTDTANNRLIRTFISLCKINGNTLNITHQEIAQIAWTTIETTTRILSKLKKDKIVSIEHGKIIINNPEKLPFYIN